MMLSLRRGYVSNGLIDCKTIQTPMEKGLQLEPSKVCDASLPFRSLIGALLWIARCTRPDIMYCVIYLSRFSASYNQTHFIAAKRVLRYLVCTIDKALIFAPQGLATSPTPSTPVKIVLYSDSDWASDVNDRKSFTGCVVFVNNCAVSWTSRKQVTVALSSVEAEYMALSDSTRECLYVHHLIDQFFQVKTPVPLLIDNKGAGYIAENEINNKMTKHINVRFHFVRQYIQQKLVELFHIGTADNISDIFTKALDAPTFIKLSALLLGCK